MKPCLSIILFCAALLPATFGFSQDIKTTLPCTNCNILQQADSIKKELEADGFSLLKENALNMESQYETPVYMPLTEGSWYHLVFIGDNSSRLYEVRMYDWDEKQVVFEQRKWADIDGNIIRYSYIPKFSEFHLMRMVQVSNTRKNVCGYAMLFKKTGIAAALNALVTKIDPVN